jgi:hypothetical protein
MKRGRSVYKNVSCSAMASSTPAGDEQKKDGSDMNNVLTHIKNLESNQTALEGQLQQERKKLELEKQRNARLSQKTREGMQSALDTLMTKWMTAVDTKDEEVKAKFKGGLDTLVKDSAEDNGVWQMMVAASALHERQEHNLDQLRTENTELRSKVDGIYADPGSRVVGEKSKATESMDRACVEESATQNIWESFAKDVGTMF